MEDLRTVPIVRPACGKHCIMLPRKDGKLLKVFNVYPIEEFDNLESFRWGDPPKDDGPDKSSRLVEATFIQNMCAWHGLAPRVFDIVGVTYQRMRFWGQIVEDAGEEDAPSNEEAQKVYDAVKALGEKYGWKNERDDVSMKDVVNGKLVDFNTFQFTDTHREKIKELYCEFGKYGKVYYQDVPELNLSGGPRKSEQRIEYLGLKKLDFANKSVADYGCAGGFFCRYAKNRLAAKVVGYDHAGYGSSDPCLAAYLLSQELHYWDIDFVSQDLKEGGGQAADIVFFLSINLHLHGVPAWLPEVTNGVCVFEDNSKERNAIDDLERMFQRVERVGTASDHGDKPIYHCYK
jgi:hypothetical protein